MEAMKKVCALGMLAAAAIAFAGCSKEVEIQDKSAGTHTLTFTVQKDIDTKTAVQEGDGVASYVWTEGDEAYIHVFENGKESTEKTVTFSSDYKIATVQATFADYDTTAFSYSAVYGSSLANKTHNPLIPSAQSPRLDSFDPAADVLVSDEPIEFEGKAKAAEDAEFKFVMKRVVSANKMTLKGLVPGEKVTKVELASDKYFASRYMIEKKDYTGDAKKLVLDFSDINAVVGTDGSFPVYFISAPVTEASFSVTVTTDQHIYTRNDFSSKLTFAVGTFRRFGINLSGYGEEISEGTVYTLVETQDDLFNGATYIIYGSGYALGEQKTNNRGAVAVTDEDGTITIDNTITVFPVVLEAVTGGYAIKDIENNGYLYNNASDKNYLKNTVSKDEYTTWTITINQGVAHINNVNTEVRGIMGFNPNNGSPLFAAYSTIPKGGTSDLALYVDPSTCVELEEAGLAYNVSSPIAVAWADKDSFVKPTLTNPHSLTVTYTSSDPGVATVDENTGDISFVGDGTTIITASSAKTSTYKAGSASYQITVTGAPAAKGTENNPYTVAEALAAARELATGGQSVDEVYISGIVSTVSSYNSTYKSITYYISDSGTTTDQFEVYSGKGLEGADFSAITDLAVGDEVTVKGYLKNYSGTLEVYQNNQIVAINYATRYTITVNSATNGTITASAASAGAQGLITLKATPNSGYELDEWIVKDASDNDVTVTNNQFTMPASNVTVSASFKTASGKTYTILWNSTNNSKGNSSYIDTWTVTSNGLTCNMANWNNNNNGWTNSSGNGQIKCGRKNNPSVATIITSTALSEAIKTVTITIDALNESKINSIKLYSSSDNSSWTEEGSFTKSTGDQSVTISSPSSNKYYKLEFDCASGSSNGLLTLSKLVLTTN